MRILLLIITLVFLSGRYCPAQDTVRFGPSIRYSSIKEPFRGKEFASRVQYAREDIVFSPTRKRVEYCYYYDTARECHGTTYELIGDSILDMGEQWIYKREYDYYLIHRYFNGTYESGYATSLIPLEKVGRFITTTADGIDTLWSAFYWYHNKSFRDNYPNYSFHKTTVTGKVYEAGKVDKAPLLLNEDSIKEVKIKRRLSYGEPYYYGKRSMTFVVTATGRIVNIEQSNPNFQMDWWPEYRDLIRIIYQMSPVAPAQLNGENVNVQWTVEVDWEY